MKNLTLRQLTELCEEKGGVASDMDGVLCDLLHSMMQATGKTHLTHADFTHEDFCDTLQLTKAQLWPQIEVHGPEFWENIPKFNYTDKYVKWLLSLKADKIISTSPVAFKTREYAQIGKYRWLRNNGMGHLPILFAKNKSILAENFVLIDDLPHNIKEFNRAGGIGILVDRPSNKNEEGLLRVNLEEIFTNE